MAKSAKIDPWELRAAILAVAPWFAREASAEEPERVALAAAVRLSVRALAMIAPGNSVELRVPPFVAVQCIEGPRHTRGTPPNVVETDPKTWLQLATGIVDLPTAIAGGRATASGTRAGEVAAHLPVVRLDAVDFETR